MSNPAWQPPPEPCVALTDDVPRTRTRRRPPTSKQALLAAALLAGGVGATHAASPDSELGDRPAEDLVSSPLESEAVHSGSASLLALSPGTPWHLQLSGKLQEKSWATVYDIDLFDTPAATLASLRSRGKVVHCYFSAGSFEDWRPDKASYPSSVLGKPMDGWPGERWVDIRSTTLRNILLARLDLAKSKGCAGVDPDNVDGYGHDTGFPLKQSDTVNFLRWLSGEAHRRGLSIGLKNGIEILSQVAGAMDWAVNEQCHEYSECTAYRSFISSGKPVFNVEYKGTLSTLCSKAKPLKLSTIKAPLSLNGPADPCL